MVSTSIMRVLSAVAGAALALAVPTPAGAAPPHSMDFYTPPPATADAALGTILRSESSVAAVIPHTPAVLDASATRVMYRSSDSRGNPVATTGTVLVPSLPWTGPGPRPTVVMGPGTQGQGDQCAPSKLMNFGQEYEYIQIAPLLARGYAVAVTDYEGLGTPGVHPYLNRASQGHAMLDLARATRSLGHLGVGTDGPIAFWGYSQGGMSAASAAELVATYAPELPVVGAVAGAPPASLADLAVAGDGSILVGGIGWVVNGFVAAYPEHADALLSAFDQEGRDVLRRAENSCVYDAPLLDPFRTTPSYTADGRPIIDHLREEPWASIVAEQDLGNRIPTVPVLVTQSAGDDLVLPRGVDEMVGKWCAGGADVTYRRYTLPTVLPKTAVDHAVAILPSSVDGYLWLEERFAGSPTSPTC